MTKIMIDVEDDIPLHDAMENVNAVITEGKISMATIAGKEVAHYCWVTMFDDVVVSTRRKRKPDSCDSFRVHYSYRHFLSTSL